MELFLTNISPVVTKNSLKAKIAEALHTPEYQRHSSLPLNLEVYIIPNRNRRSTTRSAKLTLPTAVVGEQFLGDFGGPNPRKTITIGTRIKFVKSKNNARTDIVEGIRRLPYVDPQRLEEQNQRDERLRGDVIKLDTLQFGWECRDQVFSIEHEQACRSFGDLLYEPDRRTFRIKIHAANDTRIVVIHASQIQWASCNIDEYDKPIIYFTLYHPPSFETEKTTGQPEEGPNQIFSLHSLLEALPSIRQRWSALDQDHSPVVAYTSLAIRLVCCERHSLQVFRRLCGGANIARPDDYLYPAVRRGLFSSDVQSKYNGWVARLPWPVAFQVEAITRGLLADFREILGLRSDIETLLQRRGIEYTGQFLRSFALSLRTWFSPEDEDLQNTQENIKDLFKRIIRDFTPPPIRPFTATTDNFACLHVTVTPTTFHLEGPFPERSNRVMRSYPDHHENFLRVSFMEETNLHYRFDREVDGKEFVKQRVGGILHNGLWIAGRHFKFLAYSQSALKEHAVWFVTEFATSDGSIVNAESIIASLGSFHDVLHDPNLINCPARYAARISQAFTATDASISVEVEEIFTEDDIKDSTGKWCFTDGVGTMSPELAKEVWRELRARRRRNRRVTTHPRALQIRFQGSKGMLSVDHTLSGRTLILRPSMIKFNAPDANTIEIARAFDKPGPFYLNRPLIMILEGLGVPYQVFQSLQATAISNAQDSVHSLESAARLLEAYGLGVSFRLTSVMLSLYKLGLEPLTHDMFWQQMMDFSINHVLRELKHHARIPVDKAWNLVGVADIHGYLEEGEVFIHIAPSNGGSIYLEGRTLVTRSPTIHPGDVQIARAIGRPPADSPFAQESLRNCVVFSIKGDRPLPTYLGGGDLDGDVYCVTSLAELLPPRTYQPADYNPAQKHILDRPSTMQDVADFVTEYINSDSLGIIAVNWLIIADQSENSIFDESCLLLSNLHSDAVDYPKSGVPVPLHKIPKLKFKTRPDWNAPETVNVDSAKYYQSQRAIGKLFREVDLPALRTVQDAQRSQHSQLRNRHQFSPQEILDTFRNNHDDHDEDPVFVAVAAKVSLYIPLGRRDDDDDIVEIWELIENYAAQLLTICADHTLSTHRSAMLTEEEAVIGSIVAKCSQPRKRKDTMSRLREQTNELVQGVAHQLAGEDGTLPEKSLERAWVAFRLACIEKQFFGSKSFAWIALGEIFDSIKIIEGESEGLFF
ncbi:RdRP-domain-containing protein [Abortiporus biennis]|nr:RdRP-domain-containing protein [Abortiporus biennis]